MATGTLTARSTGEIIVEDFFNSIHSALQGDFVGRNSSGVAASGQNLGTTAFPWGPIRGSSLIIGGSSIDISLVASPPFRTVSGKQRATSNQPAFLTPAGAAGGASIDIKGASTNLIVEINGVSVSVTTDITKSALTVAPNSQNTALVNDTNLADEEFTRTQGENLFGSDSILTIDTVGTEISGLVGKYAAFKINDGATDEYFIALVESATVLSDCKRGFFYDSSLAPVNRIAIANNDTITLMSLGYLFITDDATTVDVTYTAPVYDTAAPGSPATGDYWFDMGNILWKRYDGVTFQTVNRTFIGWAVIDDTDCVAARCVHFDTRYKSDIDMKAELSTTEIIKATSQFSKVNVAGNELVFRETLITWNITTDLAASADMYDATEQASRNYWCYIKDTGQRILSDIAPLHFPEFSGHYHPHNPWRAVGVLFNDVSSDIVSFAHVDNGHGDFIEVLSSVKTPGSSGDWLLMTNNDVWLPPGRWSIQGFLDFGNNGSSPAYTQQKARWARTNGTDTGASAPSFKDNEGVVMEPTAQTADGNVTAINVTRDMVNAMVIMRSSLQIFLVPSVNGSTIANSRVTVRLRFERIRENA